MGQWAKKGRALQELEYLISQIDHLRSLHARSSEHTRWLKRTLRFLSEVFGSGSGYHVDLEGLAWSRTRFMVEGTFDTVQEEIDHAQNRAYRDDLNVALGLLQDARDNLAENGIEAVYEKGRSGPGASEVITILKLVEGKLRKLIRTAPGSEKIVQESLEALLIGADIQYSREAESVEYSSKTYRPDFTFSHIDMCLEVKLCSAADREKKIIGEVNDDILAYQTRWANAAFVVYDCGFIRDVDKFASQFEERQGVLVRVVKH